LQRALFLRFIIGFRQDTLLLEQAAKLGYAPAQVFMAMHLSADLKDQFAWAERAAAERDRNGMMALAHCLQLGVGCERDDERVLALWRDAAELGHVLAQSLYSGTFSKEDWRRYHWLGRSVVSGNSSAIDWGNSSAIDSLVVASRTQLKVLRQGCHTGRVVFELGAACAGHVGRKEGTLFGKKVTGSAITAALQCIELHNRWCSEAKVAIKYWLMAAKRLNVVVDARLLIARMLWAARAYWSRVRPY
jgi:hypothetical protein